MSECAYVRGVRLFVFVCWRQRDVVCVSVFDGETSPLARENVLTTVLQANLPVMGRLVLPD